MFDTQNLSRETPMGSVVSERCMTPDNTISHYAKTYSSKAERSLSPMNTRNAYETTILFSIANFYWDAPVIVLRHTPAVPSKKPLEEPCLRPFDGLLRDLAQVRNSIRTQTSSIRLSHSSTHGVGGVVGVLGVLVVSGGIKGR